MRFYFLIISFFVKTSFYLRTTFIPNPPCAQSWIAAKASRIWKSPLWLRTLTHPMTKRSCFSRKHRAKESPLLNPAHGYEWIFRFKKVPFKGISLTLKGLYLLLLCSLLMQIFRCARDIVLARWNRFFFPRAVPTLDYPRTVKRFYGLSFKVLSKDNRIITNTLSALRVRLTFYCPLEHCYLDFKIIMKCYVLTFLSDLNLDLFSLYPIIAKINQSYT